MSVNTDRVQQQFIEESRGDLLRFVEGRLADKDEAQPIVQDAYLKFFAAGYAADNSDARPLLFTIAKNLLNDHFRHKQKRDRVISAESLDSTLETQAPAQDSVASLHSARQLDRIIKTVENMPPKRQEVFKLSRFGGLKNTEIAQRLGISKSMVEKHIAAALGELRGALR